MGSIGSRNTIKQLDNTLIRRSNDVSALDMGDSINREYQRNIDTIKGLNLIDAEKTEAMEKQYQLNTQALELQSRSINERVVAGPARRVSGNVSYDRVVDKRAEVSSHMKSLQDKSNKNNIAQKNQRRAQTLQNAIANKQLEVTFDGETWVRKSLRGKTFTRK